MKHQVGSRTCSVTPAVYVFRPEARRRGRAEAVLLPVPFLQAVDDDAHLALRLVPTARDLFSDVRHEVPPD